MEENLINDDQLQQSFKQLKKFAKQVEADYNKLIDETFDENQWRKEGQKIKSNIKKFEKTLKELTNNVQNSKDNGTASQNTISKIDEELKKINQKEVGMIKAIREKIENYSSFDENDNIDEIKENIIEPYIKAWNKIKSKCTKYLCEKCLENHNISFQNKYKQSNFYRPDFLSYPFPLLFLYLFLHHYHLLNLQVLL